MPAPSPDPPGPASLTVRRLVWLPLLLLGLAWGVVVPVLTAQALLTTAAFFGEQPSAADHLEQHRLFGHVLALSAGLVVGGLALSVWGRSTGGGWVFAVLGVPTLVLALLWVGTVPRPVPPVPARSATQQGACQEYSGGGTRCPGG
ncbi:MAG TPA: hypothetical protein VGC37_14090 [Friedmanniella sp.]